ncbi:ATP-binding protein [Rubneribacter sp.]
MAAARSGRLSLTARFSASVALVIVACAMLYLAWLSLTSDAFMQDKALAEARTLNVEMKAAWAYIDQVQDAINYDSTGRFDFKGVYCSVAGKDIAQKFTAQSEGYVIRYARDNPRSSTDQPDEFESKAIELFETTEETERFGMEDRGGESFFRYVSRIDISRNCLACHGEPAGEYDLTGFRKEGMQMGDLAGVTSISIPMSRYEGEMRARTAQSLAFFLCLTAAVVAVVRLMLRRWVTAPLMQANAQLKNENEAKSNILAMVSHELRTPLSSIMAYADILASSPNVRTEEEKGYVEEIKESGMVLLDMVNNVIDTARFEAGRFEFVEEEVDLVDVVEIVRAAVEPAASRKGVSLSFDIEREMPIVRSDSQALRIVLANLLGNAVKFTDEGGGVELSARYDRSEGRLSVAVSDTGCGIPEHELARVFDRFVQADAARERNAMGSGLGLALSKSLVTALGGSISVESAVGCGSRFDFVVPAPNVEEASEEEA